MELTKYEKNTLKACKDACLVALAYNETIKQIDKESKQTVLDAVVFNYETRKDGGKIADPKHDFLMSDKDFKDYCKFVHAERTKRGLKIPDANTTSDFESWRLLRLAEDNFIKYAVSVLPEPLKTQLKDIKDFGLRGRFLATICRLDFETVPDKRCTERRGNLNVI